MPRNLVIAELPRLHVGQRGLDRPLLIGVGALQAVRSVRTEAAPLSIFKRALMNFAVNRVEAGRVRCLYPVEAISQPVVRAVVEDREGRELRTRSHRFRVVFDGIEIEHGSRLGSTVQANAVDRKRLALLHRAPPVLAGARPASMKAARSSPIH